MSRFRKEIPIPLHFGPLAVLALTKTSFAGLWHWCFGLLSLQLAQQLIVAN